MCVARFRGGNDPAHVQHTAIFRIPDKYPYPAIVLPLYSDYSVSGVVLSRPKNTMNARKKNVAYCLHRYRLLLLLVLLVCRPPDAGAEHGEASSGGQLERIVAAVPEDAPPTYFRDRKTGKASGFAVEAMTLIAARAGFRVEFLVLRDWNEILSALRDRRADASPGMGISPERMKKALFTKSIDAFPISFFVRSGDSSPDLDTKTAEIGVVAGSVAGERLAVRGYPRIVQYASFGQGLFDLLAGKIVAFACPAPTLTQLAQESGVEGRIRIHGAPIAEIRRAIAVRKEDVVLHRRLNGAISSFLGTPEYRELYAKWYGKPKLFWTVKTAFLGAGILLTIVVFLVLAWHYRQILLLNHRLENALHQVKVLSGMLPICSACKKIRDDKGSWNNIEEYISERSDAEFSHGICPDCAHKLYPKYCGDLSG